MFIRHLVATLALLVPTVSLDAHRGPSPMAKRFGDWIVGCDATGRCEVTEARSCHAEAGYEISIARAAGTPGTITLHITSHWNDDVPSESTVDRTTYSVDAQKLAALEPGDADATLLATMRQVAAGQFLDITDSSGKLRVHISLAGASAALRYMDAAQGRAGHSDAAVAIGPDPEALAPTIQFVAPSLRPMLCRLA